MVIREMASLVHVSWFQSAMFFSNNFSYEKLSSEYSNPYSIVGYCTAYRFLIYKPATGQPPVVEFPPKDPISISDLPNRSRISQFLILPHHAGSGHGTRLYNAIVRSFLADPACLEITVEDPNERFDDLRDVCDYNNLHANGTLAKIKLNIDIDPKLFARQSKRKPRVPTGKLLDQQLLESLRTKNKLAPRQFSRLVEMHLLSQIPKYAREAGTSRLMRKANSSDKADRAFYYWRLLVKQRIYKQHRDLMIQLESEERIEKLEETLTMQWLDYERLLAKLEIENGDSEESTEPRAVNRSKRKVVDDDDDEDEVDEDQVAAKRPKAS
jgi:histone acetyltransferase 1